MSDPGKQVADGVKTGTVVESVRADRSIGELVAAATAEMSALVHDEIALAKAEIRQDAKRGAMGGAAGGIAGVFAVFAIPVLSFAAAYGIHNLGLGLAWSFLIVGAAFLVLAGILSLFAMTKFKKVKPPEKSIASAKQSAAVLQNAKPHPRELRQDANSVARSGA
jgi:Putative Actinobacterial Holin-X, holin superfamily III